jgi:AcrR family transcriptional regulator
MARKTQRKSQKSKSDPAEAAIAAALKLAADTPWREITMADIAAAAKLDEAELASTFSSKVALLNGFNRQVDEQAFKAGGGETIRENLFDLIMARFDQLAPHKAAIENILKATVPGDPIAGLNGLCALRKSMAATLAAAGETSSGLERKIKVKALSLLYLRIFAIWLKDDGADMAKTMAALDKALARAEGLAQNFGKWPGPRTAAA